MTFILSVDRNVPKIHRDMAVCVLISKLLNGNVLICEIYGSVDCFLTRFVEVQERKIRKKTWTEIVSDKIG